MECFMNETIETERLRLRKARESDLEAIFRNVWSDAELCRYMLWDQTEKIEEAQSRLARTILYQKEQPAYFVCLRDTDEAIGFAGVRAEEDGEYQDSGICLAAQYQGQGLGKELLAALCRLVFESFGGERFVYGCFHENERSAALCRSLGFRFIGCEGRVRQRDGYLYICDSYLLTKAEYERLASRCSS
ncbi:MAG: GNAT family N-acetyltransferase [Clostridia bacterium]|nr:GNAT family N-acetyltransferase [Clostridia bacterium]